jgi:hypothetical protein
VALSGAAARAKRRRRAPLHDHSDEFLEMNSGVDPVWDDTGFQAWASERETGRQGFAGTVPTAETLKAAVGLKALSGDDFGGGPRMPMVPGTWDQFLEEGGSDRQRDDLPQHIN